MTFEELKGQVDRLQKLLNDPQPHHMTWRMMLSDRLGAISKIATEISDSEKDRRGLLLAMTLHLEMDHQDRWPTAWGNKTNLGLFETAKRIIDEGK